MNYLIDLIQGFVIVYTREPIKINMAETFKLMRTSYLLCIFVRSYGQYRYEAVIRYLSLLMVRSFLNGSLVDVFTTLLRGDPRCTVYKQKPVFVSARQHSARTAIQYTVFLVVVPTSIFVRY